MSKYIDKLIKIIQIPELSDFCDLLPMDYCGHEEPNCNKCPFDTQHTRRKLIIELEELNKINKLSNLIGK